MWCINHKIRVLCSQPVASIVKMFFAFSDTLYLKIPVEDDTLESYEKLDMVKLDEREKSKYVNSIKKVTIMNSRLTKLHQT